MRLAALLLVFPTVRCVFFDINGNTLPLGTFNNNPLIYAPLINATANNGTFAGLFTTMQASMFNGVSSSNYNNCLGTLVKTWNSSLPINSTASSWNAVGMLAGNCFGDFAGNTNNGPINPLLAYGYMNTSTANTNVFSINGPLVEVSFNIFVDQPISRSINTTITAIHFGSQQYYDLLVVEFAMTNAQAMTLLPNVVFYDPVASNTDILTAGLMSVTTHLSHIGQDVFPRYNNGIFTGFGVYSIATGESTFEAVHYQNANLFTSGPLFTQDAYSNPVKLIGFGLGSTSLDNVGSKLVGAKLCFVSGRFRIELPFCLPQYKLRVINSVQTGYIQSDFNTTNFNQTIAYVLGQRPDLAFLGLANAQPQLYATVGALTDMLIDSPSALFPDMPTPLFSS